MRRIWLLAAMLSMTFLSASTVAAASTVAHHRFSQGIAHRTPTAIYKVQTNKKIIALTFDVSWGEKVPGAVLDVLKKQNIDKATFFLSGPWVLQHTETAKRLHEMGYEIGNHGYLHKNFTDYDDTWIADQVQKAETAIQQTTSVRTHLIRTPNSEIDTRVLSKLHSMGYTVVQWRTDSFDWKNPGVPKIVERVLTNTEPGDIITLHASDSCKQTAEALLPIINGLKKKGYTFVTISELLAESPIKSKLE